MSAISRPWTGLLFYVVFVGVGPIVGGLTLWMGGAILLGVIGTVSDAGNMAAGALAVSIALAPLGMLQAGITGLVAWLMSRRIDSSRRWILATIAAGAVCSALSPLTILFAYVLGRSYGGLAGTGYALAGMAGIGAVAAGVCAAACLKIRPQGRVAA